MGESSPKCVIGETLSMPNILTWEQALSSYTGKTYVGSCKGDSTHKTHLVLIKTIDIKKLKYDHSSMIRPELRKRLFPRQQYLRCPTGKVYMVLRMADTKRLANDNTDVFRCQGHIRGHSHPPHYVRMEHGMLSMKIDNMGTEIELPIIIVLNEEKF